MDEETARGAAAAATAGEGRRSSSGEGTKGRQTTEPGFTRSDISGSALCICGAGDIHAGRGTYDGATLPRPRGFGEQLRRVEEPVGVVGIYHSRPKTLSDHGARDGADL